MTPDRNVTIKTAQLSREIFINKFGRPPKESDIGTVLEDDIQQLMHASQVFIKLSGGVLEEASTVYLKIWKREFLTTSGGCGIINV